METKLFTKSQKARYWNDLYQHPNTLFEHSMVQRRNYTSEYIIANFEANARILDLGCGAGVLGESLLAHGYRVTCVDASQDMLDLAAERLKGYPSENYRLVRADIRNLPFRENAFDLVVCLGVFGYFEQVGLALSEIRRVLQPKGTFFMSVRNRYNVLLSDVAALPFRLFRLLATDIFRRLTSDSRHESVGARTASHGFRIEVHQRPGFVIDRVTSKGFSLDRFDGVGYGPLRVLGKELLTAGNSIRMNNRLEWLVRRMGLRRWSRWIADVSFFTFKIDG